jgi:hypothetical protein
MDAARMGAGRVVVGASRGLKVTVAVTLAMLVSGALLVSSAAAASDLTLREEVTKTIVEPGSEVRGLVLSNGCFYVAYGKLETNQSTKDKMGGFGPTEKNPCSHEVTGGTLKSITIPATGAATIAFSPGPKVTLPGPCIYQFPSKWSGFQAVPFSVVGIEGSVTGTLVKTGSSPECALTNLAGFESQDMLNVPAHPPAEGLARMSVEAQATSYKAEAQVQLEQANCGVSDGNPFIGTAKFKRTTSKSSVAVTYKVKGAAPNEVFAVQLFNTTGLGPSCEFLGNPVNKATKTATFTTNEKGEGSFTGELIVPRNDTEFFVTGFGEGTIQIDDSLRVSLP